MMTSRIFPSARGITRVALARLPFASRCQGCHVIRSDRLLALRIRIIHCTASNNDNTSHNAQKRQGCMADFIITAVCNTITRSHQTQTATMAGQHRLCNVWKERVCVRLYELHKTETFRDSLEMLDVFLLVCVCVCFCRWFSLRLGGETCFSCVWPVLAECVYTSVMASCFSLSR